MSTRSLYLLTLGLSLALAPAARALDSSEVRSETLALDSAAVATLRALAVGKGADIASWPVAPGRRATAHLTRREVYAPGARIWVVDANGTHEAPRSTWSFFTGTAWDGTFWDVYLAIDPELGVVEGSTSDAGSERWTLSRWSPGRWRLANGDEEAAARGIHRETSCGQDDPTLTTGRLGRIAPPAPAAAPTNSLLPSSVLLTSMHTAIIAVDTDNELMLHKFNNVTGTATNYIAALITQMNVMYQRDLLIQLVQGDTTLRVSTAADPYVQPCGAATTDCQTSGPGTVTLSEFSEYWRVNKASVDRALVMMLSGKLSNANGLSGIAWLDTLCDKGFVFGSNTAGGYSFTMVFKFAADTSMNDAPFVGHELGHNFGSPHTQCYNVADPPNPVDTCVSLGETYNNQACYAGPTSCPSATTINGVPNVRGTVMSYCHFLGGCSLLPVFHPRSVALINPSIDTAVGSCIFALDPLKDDGFESGSLSGWNSHQP